VAGAHLTLKRFLPNSAILEAEDGRVFFVINIGETARVGTTERRFDDPDAVEATSGEIIYLLNALESYFPGRKFTEKDVLSVDAGVRPLARPRDSKTEHQLSREHELRVGPDGVIHVIGVKLTDHRRAAEEIVDALVVEFARDNPKIKRKSETASKKLGH
jgi:glycerol-3-phosphate dehydrogenase